MTDDFRGQPGVNIAVPRGYHILKSDFATINRTIRFVCQHICPQINTPYNSNGLMQTGIRISKGNS